MATLAPKLPYLHPFAGGYPGRGGQYLPTDPDATDYLSRLAEADGASVEVGIAQAIEAFITGCKADNAGYAGDATRTNWDAIKSACIMCGARTLSGALVSLKSYGDELVDIDNLPTPTIVDYGGSNAVWTAESNTMQNTVAGTDPGYPRFRFYNEGIVAGRTYAVSGLLAGDVSDVALVRLATGGVANNVTYNPVTGVLSGTAVAAQGVLEVAINGTLGPSSVTIESLSIREYFANPTNVANNFVEADYSRSGTTPGLKGNGTTKYLDSGRANDADGQDDNHNAVYVSTAHTAGSTGYYIDSGAQSVGDNNLGRSGVYTNLFVRNRSQFGNTVAKGDAAGFVGHSRDSSAGFTIRAKGGDDVISSTSESPSSGSVLVFARPSVAFTDARLAFYSAGAALDLAALDTRVTNLVNGIKFHTLTGLLPNDYDTDTIAYIVSAYEAGGTL